MARGDHHGQQCSQEELSSVELAVDGTGKRVTRWLGGGQRGPVTTLGDCGVVGRGGGGGFSTVVI